jgi:hypothetical protein
MFWFQENRIMDMFNTSWKSFIIYGHKKYSGITSHTVIVSINIAVFWDVMMCSVVDRSHCFRRTCCLHSHDSRASDYGQWQYRYRDWDCGRQQLFEKPTVFVKRKRL